MLQCANVHVIVYQVAKDMRDPAPESVYSVCSLEDLAMMPFE